MNTNMNTEAIAYQTLKQVVEFTSMHSLNAIFKNLGRLRSQQHSS